MLKSYNVFYTPVPYEVELIIDAPSLKDAVQKVKDFLGDTVESVKGGWEVLNDAELEKQYGIKRPKRKSM